MTINPDRLNTLDSITLDRGSHHDFDDGHCAMEVVAWLAGEGITDAPQCASPVLTAFTININDSWDVGDRQRLKPFLPRMVGTAGDGQDEARSYLALDWLIRVYTPAWLDLAGLTTEASALRNLQRIVDMATAQAAGPVVRDASSKASAAWAAAGDAAGDAARDAAWEAAWDAAWAAAWAAARDAAWDAAWAAASDAARDAAGDAASDAARAAARDAAKNALRPTVETLQASSLDLLDRMINPSAVTA